MLQPWLIVLIALAYLGLLFMVAYCGDRRARRVRPLRRPLVYSLSFGLFFTSWGFFGTVGQAASFGWAADPPLGSVLLLVPTYIGPYLLFLFGWRFLDKMVRVGKQQKTTSIADFISARYGKSQAVAALVAVIAVVGLVPYIAVQLKSIVWTFQILTAFDVDAVAAAVPPLRDTGLYVALLLAVAAILFGVRQIDASEHHEGMMLAVAVESIVKVLAFLIVGGFITYGMYDGFGDLRARVAANPLPAPPGPGSEYLLAFFNSVFLSLIVIFTLPRHFHAASVEAVDPRDLRTARWLFPLLLLGMSVFVWPVAVAGLLHFGAGTVDPDTYMMTLPMAAGQPWLALLAFIGGFSAGAIMVVVGCVALAIMVCNDVVMPLLLRWRWLGLNRRRDLSGLLLWIRRSAILVILLAAFGYYRYTAEHVALAVSGTLAFAAVAQFGPAVAGGLYWRRASARGALAGLGAGFAVWIYTLLLPMLAPAGLVPMALIEQGPFGIAWLRPVALFGLEGLDMASHGVLWSMLANLACYVGFSLGGQRRLIERVQAAAFVDPDKAAHPAERPAQRAPTVEELRLLAERFLGAERAEALFADGGSETGRRLARSERASGELVARIEHMLAGVIGASSARLVLNSALQGRDVQLEDVAALVGGASELLQFNRDLLMSTFESVPQGISVIDRELRLVGWNRRFIELFDYPEGLIKVGRRVAEIIRFNAERGEYGPVETEADISGHVAVEMNRLRQQAAYVAERVRPDGTVLEVRGNPLPGGGCVVTYTDVTQYKRTERALRESEQNIRVYTDNVPVLITYIDRERRFRFANRAYETMLQLKREEIYGRTVDEVLPSSYMRGRAAHMEAVLKGETRNFQVELPTRDGSVRHASATYIPDVSPEGEVLGFFALFHDITDRVLAEQALQEAKQHLELRVAERTRELTEANAALAAAKLEAERANHSKTRFLAAASHDLLQPLNAAVLFCGALKQQLGEQGELAAMSERIEHALRSAEDLLGELLDISKLDAGALSPQLSDFDLHELLTDLSVEFSVLAQNKGLDFRTRSRRCMVRSDRQLLRRVLQNFLSNAIRYTHSGRVLLGCRLQGERVRIEVWDTGPGIPEDQQEQIFLEFHRLGQHDEQGEKCLGLGLAIADRIGRMLDHPISLRSRVGRGTVFAVTVPLGAARSEEAPAAAVLPAGRLAGLHVLCVDNEPAILEAMTLLLQGWGCRVSVAAGLADAQAAAAADAPVDVVVADYRLAQGENGIAVMDALRAQAGCRLPGILVTADHAPEVREAARRHGYQFLNKPVRPAVLRAVLDAVSRRPRVA